MTEKEIMQKLSETGALLDGHFCLRSGLHSNKYLQAALLLQHTKLASELCGMLADRFRKTQVDVVISPALGGIVVGHEVARHLGTRAIFAEKDEKGALHLRRGFALQPGEKVLIAEDVVTKGGRVQQTYDLVCSLGADVVGIAVLVDRRTEKLDFKVPFESLIRLNLETYKPDECPLCEQKVLLSKPGS